MWASNDGGYRRVSEAWKFSAQPVDQMEIYHAARRMQAEEFAKLVRKLGRGLMSLASALAMPYKVWRDYQETYRELSELDDRMLADIGISRSDIPRVAAGVWAAETQVADLVKRDAATPAGANTNNRPTAAA